MLQSSVLHHDPLQPPHIKHVSKASRTKTITRTLHNLRFRGRTSHPTKTLSKPAQPQRIVLHTTPAPQFQPGPITQQIYTITLRLDTGLYAKALSMNTFRKRGTAVTLAPPGTRAQLRKSTISSSSRFLACCAAHLASSTFASVVRAWCWISRPQVWQPFPNGGSRRYDSMHLKW